MPWFVRQSKRGFPSSKRGRVGSALTTGKVPGGPGLHQVLFTRDVGWCAAVATVRGPDVGVIPKAFAVVGRSSATQVTVTIYRTDGTTMDANFELAVIC